MLISRKTVIISILPNNWCIVAVICIPGRADDFLRRYKVNYVCDIKKILWSAVITKFYRLCVILRHISSKYVNLCVRKKINYVNSGKFDKFRAILWWSKNHKLCVLCEILWNAEYHRPCLGERSELHKIFRSPEVKTDRSPEMRSSRYR